MYVCDYRALFFYHSRLHINSENSNSNSTEFSEKNNLFLHQLDVIDFRF